MFYHIDTGLILSEFNSKSECPLCEIKAYSERNIVEQFLNDAVMEDDTRAKVNKYGFCEKHFDMLFSRQNKLSLALQAVTRMRTLEKLIKPVSSYKSALKQAATLADNTCGCVICDAVQTHMDKYYITVAQMFYNEPEFKKKLLSTKGFCLNHYAELLKNAKHAKSKTKEYLETLVNIQSENLSRIEKELQWFCDKHDYRNAALPLGASEDVLPRSRVKFYGKRTV